MAEIPSWLCESFGHVYPEHVAGFARLLATLRREFDGDLDLLFVLAVIGERRYALRRPPEATHYKDAAVVLLEESDFAVINIQSVSDFTGIPRETVRRKVANLESRGWISRDKSGDLIPTHKAATDLQAATDATLEYIANLVATCDAVRSNASEY